LWLIYGLLLNSLPIIITNAATALLVAIATALKAWTDNRVASKQALQGEAAE
jgi:uncharacterized protein with PQ loop repeat